MTFEAAEATLWQLVQRYNGRVGYRRGVKSEGLSASPPVIDCSGWTALLLSRALQAQNDALPRCATIGLKIGNPAWAINHPRPRGITHIVRVVRRPGDGAPFVAESFGGSVSGIRLTPLAQWLARAQPAIGANKAWAVDAFRLAASASCQQGQQAQQGNAP
jgi:hypothetical protein